MNPPLYAAIETWVIGQGTVPTDGCDRILSYIVLGRLCHRSEVLPRGPPGPTWPRNLTEREEHGLGKGLQVIHFLYDLDYRYVGLALHVNVTVLSELR